MYSHLVAGELESSQTVCRAGWALLVLLLLPLLFLTGWLWLRVVECCRLVGVRGCAPWSAYSPAALWWWWSGIYDWYVRMLCAGLFGVCVLPARSQCAGLSADAASVLVSRVHAVVVVMVGVSVFVGVGASVAAIAAEG